MAVFRYFGYISYFFICFVISRSPVQVRPVAPRAEIISAFYFFFFWNAFQNSLRKKISLFFTEWDFVCLFFFSPKTIYWPFMNLPHFRRVNYLLCLQHFLVWNPLPFYSLLSAFATQTLLQAFFNSRIIIFLIFHQSIP